MENNNLVLGFYVDKDGDKTSAKDVFIALIEEQLFSPISGHSKLYHDYLDVCTKITKEEYMEASKLFYTPEDYLR